jgi:surface protein
MSVIGGQNTPTTNGLAYIIDFNNNYISGSSTVTPILYLPTASQFTGSVPNLVNGQVQFTGSSVLRSFQTFPGFSATQGNMTLMFSGESKNSNVLFTQDGTVAVVSTTSSIGYGVPAGNLGRNFPNTGFDHVTLRFSSSSVDCFVNGIPISASGIFPTVPSSSTFNDFKIGGNYINAWTGSFSGSLGQLMVYNRVLSDDEIYSNYLIQARRYGLPEIPKPYTVDSSVYVYTLAAGITGSSTISALNTFVSGLKTAGLWDKMIAIYPFIGTSPSGSRLNLKDVSLNTTQVNYSGSWSTSLSGSYNNNTSSYGILSNITPTYVHPLINSQSIHLLYLSYDTPVSGGYLMGVEQIPGLPGDIAAPAAAYSVRKVRTAYTGFCMDVRRDSDNTTGSIGFDAFGNLDTGSLLAFVTGSAGTGSGYVTTWYDQSGNNRHAIQPTSSRQPLILISGSVTLDGTTPGLKWDNGKWLDNFEDYTLQSLVWVARVTGSAGGFKTIMNTQKSTNVLLPGTFAGISLRADNGTYPLAGNQNDLIFNNGSQFFNGNPSTTSNSITLPHVGFLKVGTAGTASSGTQIGIHYDTDRAWNGFIKELILFSTDESSKRQPIEQNTNQYFNVYTPPAYNQNSNSLSLFSSPTLVAGAANASPTQLITGGPEGLITVSRIGSSNYTLWKNRVPTRTTLPASTPLSNEIYLNTANVSNTLFSGSQNNVSYASVGAGLTDDEVYTYYELVDNLQTGLGRSKSTNPNAFITTWDTRISGTGTVTGTSSIALPLFGTQAITASWGDGTVSLISSSAQVDRTHLYTTPGVYTVSITGTGQGFQFNNGGDRLKLMDIGQWGSISGSASDMFEGCSNLVGTSPDPLILETTNLNSFFEGSSKFNGYINNWNTSNVTNFNNLFNANFGAMAFNQRLDNWNVEKVTTMFRMFWFNTTFNNNSISNWRPISCSNFIDTFYGSSYNHPINWPFSASNISMVAMFRGNSSFNQNIGHWDVSRVTNMNTMFYENFGFRNSGSADINNWRPISCSNFSSMFQTSVFNQPIGNWPISASGVNMNSMFRASSLNQNIGAWDVSKVTNMGNMFQDNSAFNNSGSADINNWRPISCSNFGSMFYNASAFNQPIGNWPISASNIGMGYMFSTSPFNQNIGSWDVSKVTAMNNMFQSNGAFNNSGSNTINNWRPISCSNFSSMFEGATTFNQPIGNWPLSASNISMRQMFENANSFNQNIGTWDVSRVTDMVRMIRAVNFNNGGSPSIGNWNTSNVTTMYGMFWENTQFKQDIGNWNVGNVTSFFNFITYGGYPYLHSIYDGWINNKLQPRVTASFSTSKYSGSAAEGRALLSRTYNTSSITGYSNDGGFMAITCSANHSVIVGNKVFISGSSFSGVNGVETVLVAGSPTTLTLNTIYDPTATGGTIITGYGWSITDGGVV